MRYFDWIKRIGVDQPRGRERGGDEQQGDSETSYGMVAPSPETKSEHEKTERLNSKRFAQLVFDGLIVLFTGALVWIGFRQSDIQDRQASISDKQLALQKRQDEASAKDTRAALMISMKIASATADQAAAAADQALAMRRMAEAAKAQAYAAKRTAQTASQELALRQIVNLDAGIDPVPYSEDRRLAAAQMWISNKGQFTIKNVRVYVATIIAVSPREIAEVWSHLRPAAPFDSVAGGVGDIQQLPVVRISDEEWDGLIDRRMAIVSAARIVFQDGAGTTQEIRRCIAYWGPPPGDYLDRDCENLHAAK